MKNLFIDTNIYLTFYHFSSDDLEELKKLSVAVENRRINLWVPEQVISEFKRNRESKIADALKKFIAQRLPNQFPQICKAYEEYDTLKRILEEFEHAREQLIEKLKRDIETKQLGADQIIKKLFEVAKKVEINETIIDRAKTRVMLGNPPGKPNSYGDSINWEIVLENMPSGEDLHFITDDQDYFSKVDENRLAEYLSWEWEANKGSKIILYRRLSDFFRSEFPDIKLASELEKGLAISDLAGSPNFTKTHLAIRRLSKFDSYSDSEIREIIEASITNDQIYWIKDDPDIRGFLVSLVNRREDLLEPSILKEFDRIYRPEQKEQTTDVEDIPF